ncbi:unnamed protein product [Commensalibacter communis]|uniref:Uncharacterized protein n=2 Tax=Commensalibacter communis TaxID=2972786 RepID=A0A9W4XH25_9PROT|nr:unnamed protein product [Commensalibacter communis]CAI3929164.1 unnamed protein product [Commensalibacter communis]CAI3933328.1 unnamed protein product [Commensalibacter communis]CAI3933864.1 unnamed protein product [Commensalibacter communis]
MHPFYQILSAFLLLCENAILYPAFAQSDKNTYMTDDKLKFVQDKANDFLKRYNQEYHTSWEALALNPKISIPQCAGAMSAKWGNRFMNGDKITIDVERYVILVTCAKDQSGSSWTVDVPTTRPDRVTVHQ